jgi:hypothetical protein
MRSLNVLKKSFHLLVVIATIFASGSCSSVSSGSSPDGEPWKPEQLMNPAELAARLKSGNHLPVIFNIGPSGLISQAIDIGPGEVDANIDTMKKELAKLPKDREVVVYCGCCPFKNCPNIRPAFNALNEAGMKNAFLLNLSENLRVDWISKGYPMD